MIRIAVLGDIGCGKTYVAKQFGYPVFNADAEVSKLYKKSRKCYVRLKKALPNYVTSFPVRKNNLLKAVMSNKNNLKKVIKIIHPEVRKKLFYDVIYNPEKTNFLLKGEELGNETKNGKMMFVCQAQLAFKIWHNILPKIDNEAVKLLGDQSDDLQFLGTKF